MSSMPRFEAASISITSSEVEAAMATHSSQTPQGVTVGAVTGVPSGFSPTQLSALARILAMLVLPMPRGPAKR